MPASWVGEGCLAWPAPGGLRASRPARRLLLLASRWHELCEKTRARPPTFTLPPRSATVHLVLRASPPLHFAPSLRQGGEVWQRVHPGRGGGGLRLAAAASGWTAAAQQQRPKASQTAAGVCGLRLRPLALLLAFLSPLRVNLSLALSQGVRKFETFPFPLWQSGLV